MAKTKSEIRAKEKEKATKNHIKSIDKEIGAINRAIASSELSLSKYQDKMGKRLKKLEVMKDKLEAKV